MINLSFSFFKFFQNIKNLEISNWKLLIALRYLKARKKDKLINITSKIAIFSLSIGVAILIISLSVIRGFEETLLNKVLEDQGHIAIYSYGPFDPTEALSIIPKEINSTPIIETHAMVLRGNRIETVLFRGVSDKIWKKYTKQNEGAIIGKNLAKNLFFVKGENISLITPIVAPPPISVIAQNLELEIKDVVKFKLHDLNRYGVFVNIKEAQNILELENKVHKIICHIDDPKNAISESEKLKKILGSNYLIHAWQEMNMLFADIMRIQRNMVAVILSSIIMLAAITCICVMILLVNMKRREISILYVLGASGNDIQKIFSTIALIISAIGTVIGSTLGVVCALNLDHIRKFFEYIFNIPLFDPEIYLLPAIPVSLSKFDILIITLFSFLCSFLSAVIPAMKTKKFNVLENIDA